MPDGNIQLTVTLEAKDVQAKTNQLRNDIKKILESTPANGMNKAMQDMAIKMDALSNKAQILQDRLKEMSETKVANPQIAEYTKQIDVAGKKWLQFLKYKDELLKKGLEPEQGWKQYDADTNATLHEWSELVLKRSDLLKSANAEVSMKDADPEAYNVIQNALGEINNTLVVTIARYKELAEATEQAKAVQEGKKDGSETSTEDTQEEQTARRFQKLKEAISQVKGVFGQVAGVAKEKFAKIATHIGPVMRSVGNLGAALKEKLLAGFKKIGRAAKGAFNSQSLKLGLKRLIQYTFGAYSLVSVFNRLKNAAKEGMQNLVRFHSATNATNKAMTEFNTSMLFIKNAWAAAFAPVMNIVIPILTNLMDALAEAGNYVARFVGALTNQEVVINAVRVSAGDYAKSLDKTSKSAKKLRDRLASFDDLNVLGKDNDDSSGYGSDSDTPKIDDMFKYVPSDNDFASMVKNAWENADFTSIGAILSEKLAIAIGNIKWDEIQTAAEKGATSFATFLNGFFGNPDLWKSVGGAIGEAINTVSGALVAFNDAIDPVLLGYSASEGLRSFLLTTDWKQLGNSISGFFTNTVDGLTAFLQNFPTQETVDAIIAFIDGLNLPQVVQSTLTFALTGIVTVIKLAGEFIGTAGYDLGLKLAAWVSTARIDKYTKVNQDGGLEDVELAIEPTVDWTEYPILALLFSGSDWVANMLVNVMTGGDYDKLLELADNWPSEMSFEGLGKALGSVKYETWRTIGDVASMLTSGIPAGSLMEYVFTLMNQFEQGNLKGLTELVDGLTLLTSGVPVGSLLATIFGFSEEDLVNGNALKGIMGEIKKRLDKEGKEWNVVNVGMEWGKMVIEGLFNGLLEGVKAIPEAIATNIIAPIVEAFTGKKGFDINSPSKKAEYWGQMIIEGFKKGLSGLWDAVSGIFTSLMTNITDALFGEEKTYKAGKRVWKERVGGIFGFITNKDGLADKVKEAFENIKKLIVGEDGNGGIVKTLKDAFTDPLGTIKTKLFGKKDKKGNIVEKGLLSYFEGSEGIVQKIKDKLGLPDGNKGIVGALKKTFTNPLDTIKTALFGKKDKKGNVIESGLLQFFEGKESIIQKVKDKFSSLKKSIASAFDISSIFKQGTYTTNNLKDSQKTLWEKLFGYTYSKGTGKKHVNGYFDNMAKMIADSFSNITTELKKPFQKVINFIYEKFIYKIIDALNWLSDKFTLKVGNNTYSFGVGHLEYPKIPTLAQGAVIPPNKEFLAMLGDQTHGTNIEAPLDTIKQAVADVTGANNEEIVNLLEELIGVVKNKKLQVGDKEIGQANARFTANQRIIRGTAL